MMQRTYLTTGERIRTYLLVAFALSLAVNAVSVLLFPNIKTRTADDATPTHLDIRPVSVHTPRPTIPPTPTPAPHLSKPRAHAAPHPIALALPKTRLTTARTAGVPHVKPGISTDTSGSGNTSDQTVTGPLAPTAAATATPSCAHPNVEASVANVVPPEVPDSARDLQLGNTSVLVEVTLDARGALERESIQQTSGNLAIDQAALRSARESTYAPKIVDCVPVAGSYIFRADFQP